MDKKEILKRVVKNKYFWISLIMVILICWTGQFHNRNDGLTGFERIKQSFSRDVNMIKEVAEKPYQSKATMEEKANIGE